MNKTEQINTRYFRGFKLKHLSLHKLDHVLAKVCGFIC